MSLLCWCQIAASEGGGETERGLGHMEWGLVVDLSTPFLKGSLKKFTFRKSKIKNL